VDDCGGSEDESSGSDGDVLTGTFVFVFRKICGEVETPARKSFHPSVSVDWDRDRLSKEGEGTRLLECSVSTADWDRDRLSKEGEGTRSLECSVSTAARKVCHSTERSLSVLGIDRKAKVKKGTHVAAICFPHSLIGKHTLRPCVFHKALHI
jgi:hypothetical protein